MEKCPNCGAEISHDNPLQGCEYRLCTKTAKTGCKKCMVNTYNGWMHPVCWEKLGEHFRNSGP